VTEKLRRDEKSRACGTAPIHGASELTTAPYNTPNRLQYEVGAMRKAFVCACAVALAWGISVGSAAAQEVGLAGLHTWVRAGGKTCMLDHFHDGSGSGATRAQAQAAAVRSWIDFTAWEYGRRWGSFANAVSKRVSCSGAGGSYSCSVSARPCRY
jgi:hypothetical protein